jgi:hypothetical protein
VDLGPLFVPHAQATELVQPREGTLDHPAPSAQPAAIFRIAHRKQRHDTSGPERATEFLRVVGSVTQHAIRTMAGSSELALKRWNGID